MRSGPLASATGGLLVALATVASPAGAHVERDPARVAAGSTTTVELSFRPGKDGAASFPMVGRMPTEPGTVLFPTLQSTAAGELASIEADDSEAEDVRPAPRVEVVDSSATAPDAGPEPTAPSMVPATAGAPSTTLDLPGTVNQAEQRDTGDHSAAPWFIGGGLAAAVVVGAGGWWLSRHR